jgi:tyrosinase
MGLISCRDWHLDTPETGGNWDKSPLWDVEHGFGGNGAYVNMSATQLPGGLSMEALTQLTKIIPGFELPVIGGSGGGCLKDGVFANRTIRIGPMGQMTQNNTRCITRGFNTKLAHASASKKSLSKVLSAKSFTEFRSWVR